MRLSYICPRIRYAAFLLLIGLLFMRPAERYAGRIWYVLYRIFMDKHTNNLQTESATQGRMHPCYERAALNVSCKGFRLVLEHPENILDALRAMQKLLKYHADKTSYNSKSYIPYHAALLPLSHRHNATTARTACGNCVH